MAAFVDHYELEVIINFSGEEEWDGFRIAEIESLCEMCGLDPQRVLGPDPMAQHSPHRRVAYMHAWLPDLKYAAVLCERAVLIKHVYELWGGAPTLDDLLLQDCFPTQDGSSSSSSKQRCRQWIAADKSWSCSVEMHGLSTDRATRDGLRDRVVAALVMEGPVDLRAPDTLLHLVLVNPSTLRAMDGVEWVYLVRVLATSAMKEPLKKMNLKQREYVGPTTLSTSLALLMANITFVKKHSMVLDPFVGTASILVAASFYGGVCFGADIDIRVLKGDMYAGQLRKGQQAAPVVSHKRDVFGNFATYGLPRPDLIRMDNHIWDRHVHRPAAATDGMFDVIVTDPPYSIRAGARKSGKKGGCVYTVDADRRESHLASTQSYAVEEVMLDLLHTAARCLRVGGSMSYLIPTPYDFDTALDLPVHPCLSLGRVCHQKLTTRHGRHLVVMHKACEYTAEKEQEFRAYKQQVLADALALKVANAEGAGEAMDTEGARGFSSLMSRLVRALASGARDDDGVVVISSNKATRRYECKKLRAKIRDEHSVASCGAAWEVGQTNTNTNTNA